MFRTDLLEQSTLEYLWNMTDRGILTAEEIDGKYEFMIHPRYIDMKDKLFYDFMERLKNLADFYVEKGDSSADPNP